MNNKRIFSLLTLLVVFSSNTYSKTGRFCDTLFTGFDTLVQCSVFSSKGDLIRYRQHRNGIEDGEQFEWYTGGILKSKSLFKKGCYADTTKSFFKNGNIESLVFCKNCTTNCFSVSFFKNGDTSSISLPKISRSFYPNHQIKTISNYNSFSQKHGLSEHWREDGTRKDSIVYRNDSLVIERQYFTNGKLRHYVVYDTHENVDTLFCFHPDGGRTMGEVIHGNGSVAHFSEDGKEAILFKYEKGKETGAIPIEDLKKVMKK